MIEEQVVIDNTQVKVMTYDRDMDDLSYFGSCWDQVHIQYMLKASWKHWGKGCFCGVPCSDWLDVQRAKLKIPDAIRKTREDAKRIVKQEVGC